LKLIRDLFEGLGHDSINCSEIPVMILNHTSIIFIVIIIIIIIITIVDNKITLIIIIIVINNVIFLECEFFKLNMIRIIVII